MGMNKSTRNQNSQKRTRRKNFRPAEKVAIFKNHLLEGTEISDLCDEFNCNEFDMQPSQFYQWQKEFFENGTGYYGIRLLRTKA